MTQDQLDALPDTSPVMDTTSGLTGLVQSNPLEDTWFVSKAFYVLCKVKLYKDVRSASGFEVTFCPHPREQFPGLPEETHLFGQTTHVKKVEEITLDSDLKRVEICVDNVHAQGGAGADFEGFKFTEMDGQVTKLAAHCPKRADWVTIDLTDRRIIGFRVVESHWYSRFRNIRSI